MPKKATRREWIGLGVIALPGLLVVMDISVLNLAVPQLSAVLKPTASQLLWIIDMYGFMIAGSLITMGTLGDRIGRRKILLWGALAFGLTSLLAAFSTSAEMLIFSRGLLGIAGATLAPSTLSLIRNMFLDPKERAAAIGIWATSFSVGAALGPLIGGALLQHFWWGSVFLPNIPLMILLLVAGPWLLPEYKDPRAGRLDLVSVGQSMGAVLGVIYGLKQIAEYGFHRAAGISMVAGVLIGVAFVKRQRRLIYPLIDIGLFAKREFRTVLIANTLTCFIMFGIYIFVAQYLQLVAGLSPLHAGYWSLPSSLAIIVGSSLVPRLARRISSARLMSAGLILSAGGFLFMMWASGTGSLPCLIFGVVVYHFGITPIFTLGVDIIMNSAPPERAGAAAGISETGTELGGALGIALLGSMGTYIYRREMARVVPAEISNTAAEVARSTLGGAVSIASKLTPEAAAEILNPARAAFCEALRITAGIGAAIAIGLAVVIALFLSRDGSVTKSPRGVSSSR